MRVAVRCPAKINLFLSVGPAAAGGYHPIRTVFQAIGLFDHLGIDTDATTTTVTFDDPSIPAENTVTKTLRLLPELVDLPPLKITIKKCIPSEAGLGGGSSNAAGLLRGLQQLGIQLEDAEAANIASGVGADVGFFLVGGRAKGEGFGERLTPLTDSERSWIAIVKPDVGVSTPEAYRSLDALPRALRDWQDEVFNDFESVAPEVCQKIISGLLKIGASSASLCGSGSACFGVFKDEGAAMNATQSFGDLQTFVAPTLTRAESLWIA